MDNSLSIPTAIDILERRIADGASIDDLFQTLRGLQRLGLSKQDIVVNLERIRAANDVRLEDPAIEEACLDALSIVEGHVRNLPIRWDLAEIARVHLPKCLTAAAIKKALPFAATESDFLPPRLDTAELSGHVSTFLVEQTKTFIDEFRPSLAKAEFYRVPKSGFTSRPAAFLAADDRIIFEALANTIGDALDLTLPTQVVWPRGRAVNGGEYRRFSHEPENWNSEYLIVADIESFYESISHTRLIFFLESQFSLGRSYLHSIEGFLAAIMSGDTGLPQGPQGSDLFATAFLGPLDTRLSSLGWEFGRYADDYLIGAGSMTEGRRRIASLEALLRDMGLRLAPSKTKLMRRSTYIAGLGSVSPRMQKFRQNLRERTERMLLESENSDEVGDYLRDAGVDEEVLFDLLYHGVATIEDVIEESRELLSPSVVQSYEEYLLDLWLGIRSGHFEGVDESVENDIRECLIGLAGARRPIAVSAVRGLFAAFPRLGQVFSSYLSAIASVDSALVLSVVSGRLEKGSETDWLNAWTCHVLERNPMLIDAAIRSLLKRLIPSPQVGNLTRTVAVRALAASGNLDELTWKAALNSVSPAVRSELQFTALTSRYSYPEASEPRAIEGSVGQ